MCRSYSDSVEGIYLKRRPSPKKKSTITESAAPKVVSNSAKEFVHSMTRYCLLCFRLKYCMILLIQRVRTYA